MAVWVLRSCWALGKGVVLRCDTDMVVGRDAAASVLAWALGGGALAGKALAPAGVGATAFLFEK